MKKTLGAMALGLALSVATLAAAAKTECPPTAQPPTQAQLADGFKNAKDRGALWSISKDGHTSYLFGTLHIGKLAWAFPGPKLFQALRETQVLAVEIDTGDAQTRQRMQAAMDQAAKLDLLGNEQARLDAQADAACVPRSALAVMHPVMQAITYTVLSGRHDGLDPSFGQELMLLGYARAQQRPIVSLETVESQLTLLLPKEVSAARSNLNRLLADLESGKSRQQLVSISHSWESGDLEAIDSLAKLCQCQPEPDERDFFKKLNDDRNPGLARGIAAEHAKGKPVLAAVGLLHMTGSQALPGLLRDMGFEVKRISY